MRLGTMHGCTPNAIVIIAKSVGGYALAITKLIMLTMSCHGSYIYPATVAKSCIASYIHVLHTHFMPQTMVCMLV